MTPTYPTPLRTAEIRPRLVWVWVAVALMVIAFLATAVLLLARLGVLQEDVDAMPRISPGRSEVVDLDAGTYSVFALWHSDPLPPDVSVVGDQGEVPIVQSADTEEYYIGNFYGRSNSGFSIRSPGSYEITNNSDERVAVGPSLDGRVAGATLVPIGIGAVLGISGLVMFVVTLVRRGRSKSRLAYGTGPPPGVAYGALPGQYPAAQNLPGQNLPGQYPGAPPEPSPSSVGTPLPPPPGNWPQP